MAGHGAVLAALLLLTMRYNGDIRACITLEETLACILYALYHISKPYSTPCIAHQKLYHTFDITIFGKFDCLPAGRDAAFTQSLFAIILLILVLINNMKL